MVTNGQATYVHRLPNKTLKEGVGAYHLLRSGGGSRVRPPGARQRTGRTQGSPLHRLVLLGVLIGAQGGPGGCGLQTSAEGRWSRRRWTVEFLSCTVR